MGRIPKGGSWVRRPFSIEAEDAVIAAMLMDEAALRQALCLLEAPHFSQPAARITFEIVRELRAESAHVDAVAVGERFPGLRPYLVRVLDEHPFARGFDDAVALVAHCGHRGWENGV